MPADELISDERILDSFYSRPCMDFYQAVRDAEWDVELADDSDALDDAAERLAQARAVFEEAEDRESAATAARLRAQRVEARALAGRGRTRSARRPAYRARSVCGARRRRGIRRPARANAPPGDDDGPGEKPGAGPRHHDVEQSRPAVIA
jgi:hypothetical protein